MIVLDASVLIAFLDGTDNYHAEAEALLAREIDDDLGVNPLTLAEVLVAPARENRIDAVRAALSDLAVIELAFPPQTATKLAVLKAGTNLKMPDCCVLLAAEGTGSRIASFDTRLAAAATGRGLLVLTG